MKDGLKQSTVAVLHSLMGGIRGHLRLAMPFVLPALAIMAMLSGCGLWRGGERDKREEPPRCITNFLSDSVHSTVLDSVVHLVSPGSLGQEVFTYTIDYGDGTVDSITTHIKELFRFPHLYQSKGRYTATITASYRGMLRCFDSAVVVIQDYVRPSLANKFRVTITGVTIHVANYVKRDGLPDSVWVTEEEGFRYEAVPLPENDDVLCIEWAHRHDVPSHGSCMPNWPKCWELGVWEPVMLSLDGKKLLSFRISSSRPLLDMRSFLDRRPPQDGTSRVDTSYSIDLYDIPLDESIPPTRERALYSMKLSREGPNNNIYFRWSITEVINGQETVIQRSIHKSIYEDAAISVEFYR